MEISYLKAKYPRLWLLFSKLIPLFSLFFLILTLSTEILAFFYPSSWAFFVFSGILVIFFIWWLIRGFEYLMFLLLGLFKFKNYQRLNLDNIFYWKPSTKFDKLIYDDFKKTDIDVNKIYHYVIIPTFQDPLEMIVDTIESIKNTKFDNKKIFISLAGEYSDRENFEKIKTEIKKRYANTFWFLNFTLHKLKEWELAWKWSNVTYSAKTTYPELLKITSEENIIVSVLDSESVLDEKYFSILNLEYALTKPNMRDKTIYQPMLFLFNRFFQAPYFSKIIALSVAFYILWASIKWIWTRAQAVQAQSLKSLLETNFYSVETITEDGHQYYRTYCTFDWEFQVRPFYAYVLLEPVIWQTFFETVKLQYNQIKRWAHWCLDLPYIVLCFFEKYKKLPKLRTLYEIFWLTEASVLWSSLQFIMFFWSIWLYLSWNWFYQLFWIFNALALLILVILLSISLYFLPWNQLSSWKRFYEGIKYVLFSFTFMWPLLLVLNWLPALHAQLMILFWKPLWKFNVTKKYRD